MMSHEDLVAELRARPTIGVVAELACFWWSTLPAALREALSEAQLLELERESRQRWSTPNAVLDALVDGSWAGPWDVDLYADARNAVTVRERGRWASPTAPARPWRSAEDPREVDCCRTLANPPFEMWGEAVAESLALVASGRVIEATLIGSLDPSTAAVRSLDRAAAENRPGEAHALRVPIPGRWAFTPPPELPVLLEARGKRGGFDAPSRTSGVWVVRRVPERPRSVRGVSADVPGEIGG